MFKRNHYHPNRQTISRLRQTLLVAAVAIIVVVLMMQLGRTGGVVVNAGYQVTVRPGYTLVINISGATSNVVLEPWGGGHLLFNISEHLNNAQPVAPNISSQNNGGKVLFQIELGGGSSICRAITLHIYLPRLALADATILLEQGSADLLGLSAEQIYVYMALGKVYVNLTRLSTQGNYTFVTQTGDIQLYLPPSQGFSLNATTINGQIRLYGAGYSGQSGAQSVYLVFNGGGPSVYVRSVDGTIGVNL
jgi:hypothetical protein